MAPGPPRKDFACYRLLIAIEAALAPCYRASARLLREVPDDYAGCLASLERGALIDVDLAAASTPARSDLRSREQSIGRHPENALTS